MRTSPASSIILSNNGNRPTIGYDANNQISQITDGAGRVVLFEQNENGYANAQIYLLLKGSTGTVWFDCVQLEEGNVINRYNLVENADFTSYSGNVPTFWTRNNLTTSDTIDTSADSMKQSYMSAASFKINGDCKPSTAKTLSHTIYVSRQCKRFPRVRWMGKGTSVSLTRIPQNSSGLQKK
jgi:hypothetical protein